MATRDEILNRVGNDLGVLRLGQALRAQDKKRIEAGYVEIYEKIKTEGAASWASTGDVPNDVAQHVIALVADNCLGTYGVSEQRYSRIKNDASTALYQVKKARSNGDVSTVEPEDF